MTREEAEKYADNMTYCDAIYNLSQARSIPYRKATFIKVNELLKALEQTRWIPVNERLPKEFTNVIVTDNETSNTYQSQYIGKGYWDCDNGYFRNRIVAWMPLPEPYKAESEG